MGKDGVETLLSHLATHDNFLASTQRQALNAIIFLYRNVLDNPIEELIEHVKAKRHRRPPVAMRQSEVKRVMAQLLYGSGLRLMECIR